MNNKKYYKSLNYLFSLFIIISSFLIFFHVSLPLFDINVTEVDKKKVIGMNTSVPLEFEDGLKFWWLIKPGNVLIFINDSDEKINGDIILELTDNPCKFEEIIKVVNENSTQKVILIPNDLTKIFIPLAIEPKSSQQVMIDFENKKECFVKNGDTRNFGAKLINWKYE